MGFIVSPTGSTTSTVQAIHTLQGRKILATSDEEYRISYYAFSDDEINYQVIDSDSSIDTFDTDIAQQPVLEPSSNAMNECQYKIWVGKNTDPNRISEQIISNTYVGYQLDTGSQCVLNANDISPASLLTFHTVAIDPTQLFRTTSIDEYRVTLNNTASYLETTGTIDFFRFFKFNFITPADGTGFTNKTIKNNSIEYIFRKYNDQGQQYVSNSNGMKALTIEIALDNTQSLRDWIASRKNISESYLLYENAITIETVDVATFNSVAPNNNARTASINILVKI